MKSEKVAVLTMCLCITVTYEEYMQVDEDACLVNFNFEKFSFFYGKYDGYQLNSFCM